MNLKCLLFHLPWSNHPKTPMRLIQHGRDFLESSTIHGLVHISTGKNALIRCIWAMIVIACFSYDIYMIENAFQSWADTPVVTSVDTKPINEVTMPEITVCPPPGTNTALNLDLVAAEEIILSETQRENLTLAALDYLHNSSINKHSCKMSIRYTEQGPY